MVQSYIPPDYSHFEAHGHFLQHNGFIYPNQSANHSQFFQVLDSLLSTLPVTPVIIFLLEGRQYLVDVHVDMGVFYGENGCGSSTKKLW